MLVRNDIRNPYVASYQMMYERVQEQERLGAFLQYYVNPTDRLLISAGVRYDTVESIDPDSGDILVDTDNTSLQAGARYEFSDAFSRVGCRRRQEDGDDSEDSSS